MKSSSIFSSEFTSWLEFILALTEKEIKARYKHAFLGFLWIILNPLLQMIVIGFVFQFFMPVDVDNYFLFLFSGLLAWNYFSYSVMKNTPMIIHERDLIQKANFPREGIILAVVFSNLFHFLVSALLLVCLLVADKVIFDGYSFMEMLRYLLRLLLIFPITFVLSFLVSGLSLLFSALNVRFRDVNFMVQAIMPLWFYATPIVYTLDLLPNFLRSFFYFNPMTFIIESYHFAFLGIMPNNVWLGFLSLVSILLIFLVGKNYFMKESKNFDDWV